jgi:hypothetical protein
MQHNTFRIDLTDRNDGVVKDIATYSVIIGDSNGRHTLGNHPERHDNAAYMGTSSCWYPVIASPLAALAVGSLSIQLLFKRLHLR